MVLVDSTRLPKAPRDCLLMDALHCTMPFSTIQQTAQLVLANYHHTGPAENNFRPKPSTTVIIYNVFDHLAVIGTLNRVANMATPDNIKIFSNQVKEFVSYLEQAAAELKPC